MFTADTWLIGSNSQTWEQLVYWEQQFIVALRKQDVEPSEELITMTFALLEPPNTTTELLALTETLTESDAQ